MGRLYDLVKAASERHPVAGNEQGTYLTMTSKDAILFGIIHICANFGLVVVSSIGLWLHCWGDTDHP